MTSDHDKAQDEAAPDREPLSRRAAYAVSLAALVVLVAALLASGHPH